MRRFLVFALMAAAVAGAACGGGGSDKPDTTATPPAPPTASAGDLARSVVQIVALDDASDPVWSGSGTVISDEGLILTNAHVVDNRADEYADLGVAVTEDPNLPPTPSYIAEIAAVDYVLDLAVIRVVSDLDGADATLDLPAVPIGDSDAVEIGEHIRILGFPGIGGETITFTEGAVSGFTSQRDIADRAWIKTDSTIAGGNSGGLAVNARGEIIGVPTIAGSSEEVQPVDCRTVVDTNRDTVVDGLDTCVPLGGFINGLRPVALAQDLIDAAESGTVYVSPFEQPVTLETPEAFDTANVLFYNLEFSTDVTEDNLPTEIVPTLPSGATSVCAFWDYEGMLDSVSWEALWFVNGELDEAGSITDDIWVGGDVGNWWVCNFNDSGLIDGLYELVLSVEGDSQASSSIYVGGAHPLVDFTVENTTSTEVCYAYLSPSEAENWGQDQLGDEEFIDPGQSRTFTIPASTYDMLLRTCDHEDLAEEFEMDITTGGQVYPLQ
ncbi:MAG: serine protease [Dehalococcoidia bacterium]